MANIFELTDLAALLQQDIDTATATLLRDAALEAIQSYTRQTVIPVTGDVFTTEPDARTYEINLPQRPVTNVSAVTLNGGLVAFDYYWNAMGRLTRQDGMPWGLYLTNYTAALPYGYASGSAGYPVTVVTVTYDHGYSAFPAGLRRIALNVAARAYTNPAGYRSENLGAYSYTLAGSAAGAAVYLTAEEQQQLGGLLGLPTFA